MKNSDLAFVRRFFIYSVLLVTVVIVAIFVSYHTRTEQLTESVLLQQGRALHSELIMTRRWISEHGGVFVKVRPGVDPNPFLSSLPGMKVNITDESGQMYTMRNPGLVVREISELAEESGTFRFHVASLKPVNPKNSKPDPFEVRALQAFERGQTEAVTIENGEFGPTYRYMAPLYFEEKCNKCHGFQNYEEGDIRGGISISIPMTEINQKLHESRLFSIGAGSTVLLSLFAALYLLSSKFMRRLTDAQEELARLASIDSLTGLFNRKVVIDRLREELSQSERLGTPLSCLMMDVDYFKNINDRFGHVAGDRVLVAFSEILTRCSRQYDIIGRYGGEEFLVILPGTDLETAQKVAEKYRRESSQEPLCIDVMEIPLTVSIGVAEFHAADNESVDSLISRADAALYDAKRSGR
ncbi:MAG: diguanylate cyclase, partial [Desulfuromonas sp.]